MSEVDPDDINYVYGIYAPLSVRLIQHISKSDSKILSDVLPLLPGPIVEHVNSDVDQGNLFIYYYLNRPYFNNYSRISVIKQISNQRTAGSLGLPSLLYYSATVACNNKIITIWYNNIK